MRTFASTMENGTTKPFKLRFARLEFTPDYTHSNEEKSNACTRGDSGHTERERIRAVTVAENLRNNLATKRRKEFVSGWGEGKSWVAVVGLAAIVDPSPSRKFTFHRAESPLRRQNHSRLPLDVKTTTTTTRGRTGR